jgi:two-component system chemotaxis response regulator CheB
MAREMRINGNGKRRIKVLVVDDSAFMRIIISDMLNADPKIDVIGEAKNGLEGLEMAKTLSPDVITMDVEMPTMNGVEAVKHIMAEKPTPIVMLSGITRESADVTLEAVAQGAFDFVTKPSGMLSLDIDKVKEELISKIKGAHTSNGNGGIGMERFRDAPEDETQVYNYACTFAPVDEGELSKKVIVIGSSTGGPRALDEIFSALPPGIPAGFVVVQHMPPYFTKSLAERLDKHSAVHVKEGKVGDLVTNGSALIAPGGYHMIVNNGKIRLNKGKLVNAIRPSVDVTMQSIAKTYGSNAIGVLLTGMGKDGADGMRAIKEKGGKTIACDEKTSVIFGMPKEAIELGCVDEIVPLYEIADTIMSTVENC